MAEQDGSVSAAEVIQDHRAWGRFVTGDENRQSGPTATITAGRSERKWVGQDSRRVAPIEARWRVLAEGMEKRQIGRAGRSVNLRGMIQARREKNSVELDFVKSRPSLAAGVAASGQGPGSSLALASEHSSGRAVRSPGPEGSWRSWQWRQASEIVSW